jgi:fatty-acyl-CoA synthase
MTRNQGLDWWLPRRRLKSGGSTAIVFAEESITYRQLADGADQVSSVLQKLGVGKGDAVAYLGENSPQFLQTMFGVLQLGAVFVPVNTRLAPPEVAHVLGDSEAQVLIHDPEFTSIVASIASNLGIGRRIVTGEGSDAEPGLAQLVVDAPAFRRDVEVLPEDAAAIIYTSGTTGKAKGAILTHANLTWMSLTVIVDFDLVSTDVALMISPLFHVASLGMGALPVLLKGGTLVVEKGFEPGRALAQIERHGVTMLSGVPTTYQLMADHPAWSATDLSTLEKLTCGGSSVPTRILNAYEARGLSFSQGYGMTEASPGATQLPAAMTRAKQGSVGLPMFFADVRIARADGKLAPPGTVGEIEVTGPNIFAGYHGLRDATSDAFTADGWYRSGDLGYLDDEGYLFIADRLKDLIISGGENIYPAEVENVMNDIDGVTGVALIGLPDERWGEVPVAVITTRAGARVDTESVRAFLDGKLARYKLPKRVEIVDALPRTASGKVRKADLRKRFAPDAALPGRR